MRTADRSLLSVGRLKDPLQVVKLDKLVNTVVTCLNVLKPQLGLCLSMLNMVLVVLSPSDKYCDGTLRYALTPHSFALTVSFLCHY